MSWYSSGRKLILYQDSRLKNIICLDLCLGRWNACHLFSFNLFSVLLLLQFLIKYRLTKFFRNQNFFMVYGYNLDLTRLNYIYFLISCFTASYGQMIAFNLKLNLKCFVNRSFVLFKNMFLFGFYLVKISLLFLLLWR